MACQQILEMVLRSDEPYAVITLDEENLRAGREREVSVLLTFAFLLSTQIRFYLPMSSDIVKDVEADLNRLGLASLPTLNIHSAQAIQSPRQLNAIVREIKDRISRAQHLTSARRIDLFLAGPAPLALFLGHRLNAAANIQCYEQVKSGQYVPTCYLT